MVIHASIREPYRRRLLRLAEVLKWVERSGRNLNMSTWGHGRPSCLSAACALGWAGSDRQLRQEGLRLVPTSRHRNKIIRVIPSFDLHLGYDAAENFFGLLPMSALWLFSPDSYEEEDRRDASVVVERVELYLRHGEPLEEYLHKQEWPGDDEGGGDTQ